MSDEQLDHAARAAFLELGPAAPVADVAKRLKVSQAALFHRTGSKEALMLRALRPGAPEALVVWASPPDATVPVHQQLTPVLRGLMNFLKQAVPGLLVLRSAGLPLERTLPPGEVPPPVALRRALADFLVRAHELGLTALRSPAVVADALLSALEARVFNGWVGGHSFSPDDDDAFLGTLIDGLVPSAAPRSSR